MDLSRIESRPTREEPNTYNFFADIVGHINDAPVAEALRGVYLRASRIRFLGSWPRVVGEPTPVRDARIAAAQEWVDAVRSGRAR